MANNGGDVLITLTDYTSFRVQGDTVLDSLNIDVSAATTGETTVDLDASSVQGLFTLHLLGNATAIHHVTLHKAGPQADVRIFGNTSTTDVLFATGQLGLIQHDASVSNVRLTIDNSSAPAASILTLTATTFGNWIIPALDGVSPHLNISALRAGMEIFAGAGDQFQLDVTPPSIDSLTIHNDSMAVQDTVYTANWAVPLILMGNLAFFAGQKLHTDGTVERVKRLNQVNATVTLYYAGTAPSQVVLDGDLDAPGAQYTLAQKKILVGTSKIEFLNLVNQTVGLDVRVKDFARSIRSTSICRVRRSMPTSTPQMARDLFTLIRPTFISMVAHGLQARTPPRRTTSRQRSTPARLR